MLDAAVIFAAQFAYVCVLGLQSLAVNHGRYLQAATQSFLLGTFGFAITNRIVRDGEVGSAAWFAYVAAGPAGVVFSMWLFKRMKKCKS